ncbi:MAG: hypothetical protein ACI4WG_03595 [Erysipelotrichaceae bacterium]
MAEYVDIGKRIIRTGSIKTFSVVPVEYIFRPTYYEEDEYGLFGTNKGKKYRFIKMEPYAAIIGENNSKVSEYKSENFIEVVAQDLIDGVTTTIGDLVRIKAARSKKYRCVRPSGAMYNMYLEDIPALIIKSDGREMEIRRGDELFGNLGDTFRTVVKNIPALYVEADKNYIFYGEGIQISDVDEEFQKLKFEFAAYKAEQLSSKKEKQISLGKVIKQIPINIPKINILKENDKEIILEDKEQK